MPLTKMIEQKRKKNDEFLYDLTEEHAPTESVKCNALTNNRLEACNAKEKNINALPPELLNMIFSYLPITSFAGNNNINQVCKYWDTLVKESSPQRDKAAIIKSAKNLDNALLILREEALLKGLTPTDMLSIVAQHPVIIKKYLSENKLLKQSDIHSVYALDNDALALNFFIKTISSQSKAPIPFEKTKCALLNTTTLVALGQANHEIAQHILETETLQKKILSYDIRLSEIIGCAETAQYFLNNTTLRNSLIGKDLEKLGKQAISIAKNIMDDPDLFQRLERDNLAELGKHHSEIADQILNTPKLCSMLSAKNLATLGEKNLDIAQRILETFPSERLEECVLEALGTNHVELAWDIIQDEKLYNKLSADSLVSLGKDMEIALNILKTPKFCKKLSNVNLIDLADTCKHVDVAWHILKKPKLCDTLNGNHLVILAQACAHIDIASHILMTPKFCNKLDGKHLMGLATQHYAIAKAIFETPELYKKLKPDHIMDMFIRNHKIAAHILETDQLKNKFEEVKTIERIMFPSRRKFHFIFYLLENYTESASLIKTNERFGPYNAPFGLDNESPMLKQIFEVFRDLAYTIKEIANQLYQEPRQSNVHAHLENTETHEKRLRK